MQLNLISSDHWSHLIISLRHAFTPGVLSSLEFCVPVSMSDDIMGHGGKSYIVKSNEEKNYQNISLPCKLTSVPC